MMQTYPETCRSCGGYMTDRPAPGCNRAGLHDDPDLPPPADDLGMGLDPDIDATLGDLAQAIGLTVGAYAGPLAQALQEARAGAAELLDRYTQTYAALAALVAALDAGTVRANWAADAAILDQARSLVDRLSPIPTTLGGPDADTQR